jgi:hypothetical protein
MSDDLMKRLREAALSTRTTERPICDEAAGEIERLRTVIQTAFGLLWHNWMDEARVHLSKNMSMDDKAKGIGIAKTYPTDNGPVEFPAPITKALEALNTAASSWHWEDGDHGWVKYRAAEVMLRHWAEGIDAWVKES